MKTSSYNHNAPDTHVIMGLDGYHEVTSSWNARFTIEIDCDGCSVTAYKVDTGNGIVYVAPSMVTITHGGRRYHTSFCKHRGEGHRGYLTIPAVQAESEGRTPCAHCGGTPVDTPIAVVIESPMPKRSRAMVWAEKYGA